MAEGSVHNSNIKKGYLYATCNGKLLPNIKALYVPNHFAASLISSPQLVLEDNMDMVHSKHHGSFLQPACDSCPICMPHANRIMIATTATEMSMSITPYATHAFLGKSELALNLRSTPLGSNLPYRVSFCDKEPPRPPPVSTLSPLVQGVPPSAGGGFGATRPCHVKFKDKPSNFHRFSSPKPPNPNVRPLHLGHGAAGQAMRRAIAGAVCSQELVSINPSDLLCAGKGAPYKCVFWPFSLQ